MLRESGGLLGEGEEVSARLLRVAFLVALHLSVVSVAQGAAGVVVEKVTEDSAPERAGLRAGDVVVGWSRWSREGEEELARGAVTSPFVLDRVGIEQLPRGGVRLTVLDGGRTRELALPAGPWGLTARPMLSPVDLELYGNGRPLGEKTPPPGVLRAWQERARQAADAGETHVAAWWILRVVETHARRQHPERALEALDVARQLARESTDLPLEARLLEERAQILLRAGRPADAIRALQDAAQRWDLSRPDSLAVAATLHTLGNLLVSRTDLDRAEETFRRALGLRESLAPGSRETAATLNNLAIVATEKEEFERAERLFHRSLSIYREHELDGVDVARVLNGLGSLFWSRRDLETAEHFHQEALEIQKRHDPGSLSVAISLNNLGLILSDRGELAEAQARLEKALELLQRLAPGSLEVASTLNNLGSLAWERRDLRGAEAYYRRSLAIREKLAPESIELAETLHNLGILISHGGNPALGQRFLTRALEIQERQVPGTLRVAQTLAGLGGVALDAGELEAAAEYHARALEIRRRVAPSGRETIDSLNGLAAVAARRGEHTRAVSLQRQALELVESKAPSGLAAGVVHTELGEQLSALDRSRDALEHLSRAVDILERAAPGTTELANAHFGLGRVLQGRGRGKEALDHYRRAVQAVDAQRSRLGGSELGRAAWMAKLKAHYHDYLELALEMDLRDEAFEVLERFRARGLVEFFSQRDLVLDDKLPPDLDRDRRRVNVEYDRLLSRLLELSSRDGPDAEQKLRQDLDRTRLERLEIERRARSAAPEVAALQYPRPLDLEEAGQLLKEDELLLSYFVGEEKTFLFSVEPGPAGLRVERIERGREELHRDVSRFRAFVEGRAPIQTLHEQAESLTRLLLGPVAASIARSGRIVVIPDGPLHSLPFAALLDPGENQPRYLVQEVGLSRAASATVLASLRQRGVSDGGSVVAFGDPLPGPQLGPLPASRREVVMLARLFGERSTIFLGREATEEAVETLAGEISILHFATHAVVDEGSPLESALVLTSPGGWSENQENGLLQAWEIIESLDVEAGLVTLSACETGLGREMAGEGMLGLTRAFHLAGARSVLASLWKVEDTSSFLLMSRFYENLRRGQRKEEALRSAQLELLEGEIDDGTGSRVDLRHPFHWAAFVLFGDSR